MLPSRLTGPRALREIEPMVYRGRDADPGPRAARMNRVALRLVPFGEDFIVLRARSVKSA